MMFLTSWKKIYFDIRLRTINDKEISNETKYVEGKKTLNYNPTFYIKLLNDLTIRIKLTQTEGLTKDLINYYNCFYGEKYSADKFY